MKRALFIDRDGTIVKEPSDFQVDAFEKVEFLPHAISNLGKIARELDFELVMVSNQDGLGTPSLPEERFFPVHAFILKVLQSEGVVFSNILLDRTFARELAETRKPGTGLLRSYMDGSYDLENSYVIGDRITDVMLAKNLGARAIWLNDHSGLGADQMDVQEDVLRDVVGLETLDWGKIYEFLKLGSRTIHHQRSTKETRISIDLNLDGSGHGSMHTGIGFFDHMLDQLARHGQMDLSIQAEGDLHIDEHHTIEDVGIALGEAFGMALGEKKGIERYGFCLPMDDCLAQVALDFGGRSWIVWETSFQREKIGSMPTEMFFHFFKSFSDAARCNLNIQASGSNEHHKIEAIFKAFAKAIKMAVRRDIDHMQLPSTKGLL